MSSVVQTLDGVKARAAEFCRQRDWQVFHTPCNLALALSGECGEVSEIFQWKGPLDSSSSISKSLTDAERVHIGEEIADVLIYSARLCDQCGIDLAYCTRFCARVTLSNKAPPRNLYDLNDFTNGCIYNGDSRSRADIRFDDLDSLLAPQFLKETSSPRMVAFSIQSNCGRVCELFASKSEEQSAVGLPGWTKSEVADLAILMGSICLLLSRLAKLTNNSLCSCVTDKFKKNDAKYPVELAKGSSDKYTAYTERVNSLKKGSSRSVFGKVDKLIFLAVACSAASAFLGFALARRFPS
jgi:NTP pyrophosphatase (non-canonical NTP hydrolase)